MSLIKRHRPLSVPANNVASRWAVIISILALLFVMPVHAQEARSPGKRPQVAPVQAVVVFLVRHAEKSDNDARDPDLSEMGRARAGHLARLLSGAGVTHLFSTEYKRTQQTLAPLSKAAGVEVTVIGGREMSEQLEALRQLAPGSVAVVAGHSNTIPAMVSGLAGGVRGIGKGGEAPSLGENEYDALFQVVLPPPGRAMRVMTASSLEMKYGD